jgi:uncharacterized protein (DUF302 family)
MIVTRSISGHAETLSRLIKAIASRGLTLFAVIDHAAAAKAVGLDLRPEAVVLLGNPQAGTPLMQSDPRIGAELPLRMLVWQDDEGTLLGYADPRDLAQSYDVGQHEATLESMSALLAALAASAAG